MFKNYFKIVLRNFLRQKFYSFINLAGLTVGLTCFILISLYIQYEFSYESIHENLEDIYRVNIIQKQPKGDFKTSYSMVPLAPALVEEITEIKDFARILNSGETLVKFEDNVFYESNVVFTDPGIFNLFTIPVVYGDPHTALSSKNSVVITKSMAEKYFGNKNPVGESIIIDNEDELTITAVVEDFPNNTYIDPDFMISFETIWNYDSAERFMNNWISTQIMSYVLLKGDVNLSEIETKINSLYGRHAIQEVEKKIALEQFRRIHLYSDVSGRGDIQYIYIFLVIGIFMLLIAATNFMNLSTARSAQRANEIGLRKVVGASRWSLAQQFLGESILFSSISMMLAILVVDFTLPYFENITNQELSLPTLSDLNFYGLLLFITIILGLLSGSYPAILLSRFKILTILRGKSTSSSQSEVFRKTLVVIQFSIAIGLITCMLTINDQLDYMQHKELGFQKDQILVLPVRDNDLASEMDAFKHELIKRSDITAVAVSWRLPTRIGNYNNVTWEGASDDESIAIIQNKVGYDFIDTYEMEILLGRNFSREITSDLSNYDNENAGSLIINEEAVRRFGWDEPIGKKIIQVYGDKRNYFDVIGVMKDFHFSSLKNKIRPLCFYLEPKNLRNVSIKFKTDNTQELLAFVEEKWKQFNPAYPFDYFFLDQSFDDRYASEEKINKLFGYFSFLAIFISCLGLLGLASHSAEQRRNEIGVRKVLGANVSSIIFLLSKQHIKWILLANIFAWPFAYIYLDIWLDNFAYRIDIIVTPFVLASLAGLMIAILTVSWQVFRAATANPVESLKNE